MWFILLCLAGLFMNAQAMENEEGKKFGNAPVKTYLQECGKKDLKKDGLCRYVSSKGVTISARKQGATIKLTTKIHKATDTANEPEFGNAKADNDALGYSLVGLRALMHAYRNNDNPDRKTECTTRHSLYVEKYSGRTQSYSDRECVTYISAKKVYKLNGVKKKKDYGIGE